MNTIDPFDTSEQIAFETAKTLVGIPPETSLSELKAIINGALLKPRSKNSIKSPAQSGLLSLSFLTSALLIYGIEEIDEYLRNAIIVLFSFFSVLKSLEIILKENPVEFALGELHHKNQQETRRRILSILKQKVEDQESTSRFIALDYLQKIFLNQPQHPNTKRFLLAYSNMPVEVQESFDGIRLVRPLEAMLNFSHGTDN